MRSLLSIFNVNMWSLPNDKLEPYYKHIDFCNASVAGSYALYQFTCPSSWLPNDVDILTSHATFEEFCTMVTTFCQASGATDILTVIRKKIVAMKSFTRPSRQAPRFPCQDLFKRSSLFGSEAIRLVTCLSKSN